MTFIISLQRNLFWCYGFIFCCNKNEMNKFIANLHEIRNTLLIFANIVSLRSYSINIYCIYLSNERPLIFSALKSVFMLSCNESLVFF